MASILRTETRQKEQIKKLRGKERWMKRGIIASLGSILLLLLLLGYATDWTRGLRKDNTTPLSSSLDSLDTATEASGTSGPDGGSGGGTRSTTGASAGRESTTSSTDRSVSTTNNTTTTANPTPNPAPAPQPSALLQLYSDYSAGDNINEIIDRAGQLGITVECGNDLIFQTCTLTQDGVSLQTKNLLGTNILTSMLKL